MTALNIFGCLVPGSQWRQLQADSLSTWSWSRCLEAFTEKFASLYIWSVALPHEVSICRGIIDQILYNSRQTASRSHTLRGRCAVLITFSWTEDWQVAGHGISMTATGEPKSGTTWLGRLIPHLALELCGSLTNPWCVCVRCARGIGVSCALNRYCTRMIAKYLFVRLALSSHLVHCRRAHVYVGGYRHIACRYRNKTHIVSFWLWLCLFYACGSDPSSSNPERCL